MSIKIISAEIIDESLVPLKDRVLNKKNVNMPLLEKEHRIEDYDCNPLIFFNSSDVLDALQKFKNEIIYEFGLEPEESDLIQIGAGNSDVFWRIFEKRFGEVK